MARKSRKETAAVVVQEADAACRAAIYVRLSVEDTHTHSVSIETQQMIIARYLEQYPEISVYDTYIDNGATGTNFHRPGFQQMLSDIEAGHVNCVIVKDLSRLGRNTIDTGYYIEQYFRIQDDCIRKNPFDFQLNTVLEDDTEPKEPLSPTQEAAFLSFVQHDKVYQKYYDEIIILLGTGLRISELCGLTEADIDLDKQLINVDHQLLKIADVGYYVETPKTKSGNRVIPMSEKVLEAFQRVLNKRKYVQPVILEGYTKFLFLNRNGLPKVAVNYESMFRGLVRKYNKTQKVALPKVMTPHTLRHTFCTTLANAGMNPKALQYIMGHSNINMTLNYYAHTTSETSITEMKRLIA